MLHKKICLFGICLDNLNKDEVVEKILSLIEHYQIDSLPKYVSTLNVDFLRHMLSWNPGNPANPELNNIIQQSAVTTPDGMPIVWLSKLLNTPLKERVTGIDLVPALCIALGEKSKSIYLLGGDEAVNKQAILKLQEMSPGLKIAGMACPFIAVNGENLVHSEEFDSLILEDINKAEPDVLLLNLGNPKQEIWFERVKHQLKVPVSIGIGGTLDKIGGRLQRAPEWMQNSGLEWLHRLFQEPGRLWKRYLIDIIKFFYVSIPLLSLDLFNRLFFKPFGKMQSKSIKNTSLLFLSPHHSIATLPLPSQLNQDSFVDLKSQIENILEHDVIVVDFQHVKYIDPVGVHFILSLWHKALSQKKEIFGLRINWNIRWLLKLHRAWGFIANRITTSDDILQRIANHSSHPPLYESVQQYTEEGSLVVLSFFGQLDHTRNYDKYFLQFTPLINQKNCVIDLQYCNLIENAGFSFLLKIRQFQMLQHRQLAIVGVSPELLAQFKLAKVNGLFHFYSDLEEVITNSPLAKVA